MSELAQILWGFMKDNVEHFVKNSWGTLKTARIVQHISVDTHYSTDTYLITKKNNRHFPSIARQCSTEYCSIKTYQTKYCVIWHTVLLRVLSDINGGTFTPNPATNSEKRNSESKYIRIFWPITITSITSLVCLLLVFST